jgi:hypothetical protein
VAIVDAENGTVLTDVVQLDASGRIARLTGLFRHRHRPRGVIIRARISA